MKRIYNLLFLAIMGVTAIQFNACKKKDDVAKSGDLSSASAAPDSALPRTLITISGVGINGISKVEFDTISANFNPTYNTESNLLVYVPQNANYGPQKITLTNTAGKSLAIDFVVIQPAPTITSVNPLSASPDSIVTVTGNYFKNIQEVLLGAVAAEIVDSSSQTELKFRVPQGVPAGRVTITTAGGTVVSSATVVTETAILISDFDGGGIRPDGNSWYSYGDMSSKAVASSAPDPYQGNFLKAISKSTSTSGYAGVSTYTAASGSQTFGLTKDAAHEVIKFEANSNGIIATQIQVLVEDENAQNYNKIINVNWSGWQTVEINCDEMYVGYGVTEQTEATKLVPSKIKTIKFHFQNYVGSPGEVNLDNIRFVEEN